MLRGPVEAEVLRVVDGDRLAVRAEIWLGQTVEVDAAPDFSAALRAHGLARGYDGAKRGSWCEFAGGSGVRG